MRANLESDAVAGSRPNGSHSCSPGGWGARKRVRSCARRPCALRRTAARSRDALAGSDTGLSEAELAAALDPATYLGSAGALVDRALARYSSEGKT